MAKTGAERIAAWRLRKRENGLCSKCGKACVSKPRSVCQLCSYRATRNTFERRKRIKERSKVNDVIARHERAGDTAHEHHLYENAAEHYQHALSIEVAGPSDRLRISEKLAYVLSLGRTPHAASPLFDRVLAIYLHKPAEGAKTVEILLQQARQLWITARTEAAIPLLTQAIEVAEADGDQRLCGIANCAMADYLITLGRYEEAMSYMAAGKIGDEDDAATRASYLTQSGVLSAAFGRTDEAIDYFERAIDVAKKVPQISCLIDTWIFYVGSAQTLGNIKLAKNCCEQALLVARRHHIIWRMSTLCLAYANILSIVGKHGEAYEYFLEALSYEASSPLIEIWRAMFGIPIALHRNDETALAECAQPRTIDFALRSANPNLISHVAASLARWHSVHKRKREAQTLLHRIMKVITRVGTIWEFPIAVSRFGSVTDIPKARQLIERRVALPCADLARASLSLFDAFVAQRKGQPEMHRHAIDAKRRFEALGWHGYAEIINPLLPGVSKERVVQAHQAEPFADLSPGLTVRERQVAALALKGMTNRRIAKELAISENTVETHMASIMNRLGIHSRHQLVHVLADNHI